MKVSLLIATCVWLGAATASAEPRGKPGPVVLVGIDGMSFDVLEPLIAAGRTPFFAELVRDGAHAVLRSERPMRSPALWTTVATGQPRDVHGVYDFVTGSGYWPPALRNKPRRIVTSDMRKAPALWRFAGDAGRSSLVVGWMNTWPAQSIHGAMVAPYVALGRHEQTSIKGKVYESASRQTAPAALFAELKPLVLSAEQVNRSLIAQHVDEPAEGSPLYREIPRLKRYLYTVRWSIAAALTNARIVGKQLGEESYDLVMTYFDGADTLAHRFWIMRESEARIRARLRAHGFDPKLARELKRRFGRAIDGYYELLDGVLAGMARAAGPNATIVVVSDHGWGTPKGARAAHDSVPFDGEHRLDGVFIARGPNTKPGRVAELTLYDVAPTTLALLGIAPPTELPGRVADIFQNEIDLVSAPVSKVERRRAREAKGATHEAPFADQELERLQSLGYIQ